MPALRGAGSLLLALPFSMLMANGLRAQDAEVAAPAPPAPTRADSLFAAGQYQQAIPLYYQLLNRYPRDGGILYALGVSYMRGTRNAGRAIVHLEQAATRPVPNLVYFYLGEAYRHTYRFDRAVEMYRRFTLNGGDPSISQQDIEQRLSQCENGSFMIRFVHQPQVVETRRVHRRDFHQYLNTRSADRAFVPKPKNLKTRVDISQGDSSLIFFPLHPAPGDRVVYASYGGTTTFGRAIHMIQKQADGLWSRPLELGEAVNSDLGNDYPYLMPDGQTLYFASRGHYGMGGFDLYRVIFNPSLNRWGQPENLGFPFNSPHDDIMFVPNAENTLATLVTNRNVMGDSVEVIVVRLVENPIRRAVADPAALAAIASLTPQPEPGATGRTGAPPAARPQPRAHKAPAFSAVENDPEYVRALSRGFQQQQRSDSLRVELQRLRQGFDHIYTAEERRRLEARVVRVEDALLAAQQRADEYFAQANRIEQEYLTGLRTPARPTASFASDSPEFLYQAQFAPTVFKTNELSRLAQMERMGPQIEALRGQMMATWNTLQGTPDTARAYASALAAFTQAARRFNPLLGEQVHGKRRIYAECIAVALVKRDAVNQQAVRAEIDHANRHFHNAAAIRNNATPESTVQSEFEALLLEELGVLRLELAFARLWGMQLFEQALLSRLHGREQAVFGRATPIPADIATPTTEPLAPPAPPPAPAVSIEFQAAQPDLTFRVVSPSPYTAQHPIPNHLPLPLGLVYKIQIGVFSNPPPISFFKGITPLSAEPVGAGPATRFYAGLFARLAEAQAALRTVRELGFADAFVVAWHDGRAVALPRAQTLERETHHQPPAPARAEVRMAAPPGRYLIRIGTFRGRLPDDVAQTVRAMAPGRDVIRKPDGAGGFSYSIGAFSSFDDANRVRDKLVASGLDKATVVPLDIEN